MLRQLQLVAVEPFRPVRRVEVPHPCVAHEHDVHVVLRLDLAQRVEHFLELAGERDLALAVADVRDRVFLFALSYDYSARALQPVRRVYNKRAELHLLLGQHILVELHRPVPACTTGLQPLHIHLAGATLRIMEHRVGEVRGQLRLADALSTVNHDALRPRQHATTHLECHCVLLLLPCCVLTRMKPRH